MFLSVKSESFKVDGKLRYQFFEDDGSIAGVNAISLVNLTPDNLPTVNFMNHTGTISVNLPKGVNSAIVKISPAKPGPYTESVWFDNILITKEASMPIVSYFAPNVVSSTEYWPFGYPMKAANPQEYRFGFQGQEKDNEWTGQQGSHLAFKYRVHDARIGRFLSIDPLTAKYPHNSPYAFSENCVINSIELEGLEKVVLFGGADLVGNGGTGSAKNIALGIANNPKIKNINNVEIILINSNYMNPNKAVIEAYSEIVSECDPNEPLVIYGYSKGGEYALELSRMLDKKDIKVDLLITVDAADGPLSKTINRNVSDNVEVNENYYQTKPSKIRSRGGENISNTENVRNHDLTGMTIKGENGKKEDIVHGNIDNATMDQAIEKISNTISSKIKHDEEK